MTSLSRLAYHSAHCKQPILALQLLHLADDKFCDILLATNTAIRKVLRLSLPRARMCAMTTKEGS